MRKHQPSPNVPSQSKMREESTMSALLPVLLCGGGCLAMCWVMMRGMHRQGDDREAGRTASGSAPDGATNGHGG